MLIVDEERHLRISSVSQPFVAGHGHQLGTQQGHKGHALDVIDTGEEVELLGAELWSELEEPVVDALTRLPPMESIEEISILGPDRAYLDGRAVIEDGVDLPLLRVLGWRGAQGSSLPLAWPENTTTPSWLLVATVRWTTGPSSVSSIDSTVATDDSVSPGKTCEVNRPP